MAEKANYPPELQAAAPPTYEQPPAVPQEAHRAAQGPGAELHLEQMPPQGYANVQQQAPGPWNPSPQMYPPQQYAAPAPAPVQNHYPTAIPLHALERTSQVVDCPMCHTREMTRTEAVNGATTHGWAAVLCCCACIGCIPYFMAAFKDVEHKCGKCNYLLATYHGSGHVVIHQQQIQQAQQPAQGQPVKQ